VPHRYCANHFLRDVAKPVLEADSRAKVKMRHTVRGLRAIEREVLAERGLPASPRLPEAAGEPTRPPAAQEGRRDVGLDYCTAVRGILNDDQGGPLHPPGLRMTAAWGEVRASLQRDLEVEKGGQRTSASRV
jgi:hypothetical protein